MAEQEVITQEEMDVASPPPVLVAGIMLDPMTGQKVIVTAGPEVDPHKEFTDALDFIWQTAMQQVQQGKPQILRAGGPLPPFPGGLDGRQGR